MAKPIMIQGTMSNVGKSLLTAGLCRIFRQDGKKAAPFKSQNMALNSYITEEGLEMGRAQVVQAESAGIRPSVHMNPILLKPTTDVGSQVIVHGVSIGNMRASQYFSYKKALIPEILTSYRILEEEYDVIVIEGAGSPAEINLNKEDIVNMGMASLVDAPVILVADIDRGGVFAQLYGTVMLLPPGDRARIKGLIINKFRGERGILEPGLDMIEELCGIPVLGVIPCLSVDIEDEDSLGDSLSSASVVKLVDIAVIRLPKISNFTDFQVFLEFPWVSLRYVERAGQLGNPDMILIPGTKSTVSDLLWMRQNGLEALIIKMVDQGVPVMGICGGYQMLGTTILDSDCAECESGETLTRGMGLLPVETRYRTEKTTTRVKGRFSDLPGVLAPLSGMETDGYEIHMGVTSVSQEGPVLWLEEYQNLSGTCKSDGAWKGNVYGTYMHGIFDGPGVAVRLTEILLNRKGLKMDAVKQTDRQTYKEQQYEKLASGIRSNLDMAAVYRILNKE